MNNNELEQIRIAELNETLVKVLEEVCPDFIQALDDKALADVERNVYGSKKPERLDLYEHCCSELRRRLTN